MRIIAGSLKAKKLQSPKTEKTRPTLDRVKEAMFSILSSYLSGAMVLDLFSGTGNLGLEAISRGAKFAFLNDDQNLAISTIISNVQLTNVQNYVKITKKDYRKCLNQLQKEGMVFDVIFLDPPYDSDLGIDSLKIIASKEKGKLLAPNGIVVYETDKNFVTKYEKKEGNSLQRMDDLVCFDERTYGNVVLKMYKWEE